MPAEAHIPFGVLTRMCPERNAVSVEVALERVRTSNVV